MWEFFISNIELFGFGLAVLAFFRPELEKITHKILNGIDFYPHSRIELGFFDFDPTIGIPFTIRGRGGNQLISSISLKLIRERDGATYNYKWGLFRVFSASQTGTNVEENLKAELATAFLLPKDGSNILNVQFHDGDTQKRFMDEILQLKTAFENFVTAQGLSISNAEEIETAQKSFKAIPENNDLILRTYTRLGREFYWEEGNYKVFLEIKTDKPRKNFKFDFSFSLSGQEAARMDLNRVGLIQAAMSSKAIPNFVNPEIQTSEN